MTVSELIETLQSLPQHQRVVAKGSNKHGYWEQGTDVTVEILTCNNDSWNIGDVLINGGEFD